MKNLLLFTYIFLSIEVDAQRLYVSQIAQGQNNGNSWEDAYTDLAVAIDSARAGDVLWVAKGEYKPLIGSLGTSIGYEIDKPIHLFGGFNGDEININQRDLENNKSLLSTGTNLLLFKNVGDTCIVDGFDISNGGINNIFFPGYVPPCDTIYPDGRWCYGGGIYFYSDSSNTMAYLKVKNCSFSDNQIRGIGGCIGVFSRLDGAVGVQVDSCTFSNSSGLSWAGALAVHLEGSGKNGLCEIKNSTFKNCNSRNYSGALHLFSLDKKVEFSITDCSFLENTSQNYGPTAIFFRQDSGLLKINNCIFKNNSRLWNLNGVQGVIKGSNIEIVNSIFDGNVVNSSGVLRGNSFKVHNSIFSNNKSDRNAGVFSVYYNNLPEPDTSEFINCTFVGNHSDGIGAIGIIDNAKIDFSNCVFQNNTSENYAPFIYGFSDNSLSFKNNILDVLEDSLLNSPNPMTNTLAINTSNLFDTSIYFQDTSLSNFALSGCSIGRNFGDSSLLPLGYPLVDVLGNSRIQDGQIDIGAYETGSFSVWADSIMPASCDSAANGSVFFDAENASGMLSGFWLNDAEVRLGGRDSLLAGEYSIVVSDAVGCSDTVWLDLPVAAEPFFLDGFVTQSSGQTIADGSIDLMLNPPIDSMSYTFDWSNGQVISTAEELIPGNYTVTVTDVFGCSRSISFFVGVSTLNDKSEEIGLQISPNPVSNGNLITIFNETNQIRWSDVRIFSATGQLFKEYKQINQFKAPYEKGLYWIELSKEGHILSVMPFAVF